MMAPLPPPTRDDIRAAYRLLLDREPDQAGLEFYAGMAGSGQLGFARLREILLASEEYRGRFRRRRRRVEIGGATVVVDAEEPAFGANLAATGAHDPHLAAVIARHLAPGATYVDVGANVGALALPAARLVGPSGRVVAFEPDPGNASLFLAGVAANGFDHVRLFPLALSDAPRVLALQGGSNGYLVPAGGTDIAVQALPGDALLAGEARLDLVKLDVEGHEPQALRGLAGTLRRHRPWVLAEFNPRCLRSHGGTDPLDFAGQLFRLAPRVTAIRHDGREASLDDPAALLGLWEACDREAVGGGRLPPGMIHLDVLFRAAPPPDDA